MAITVYITFTLIIFTLLSRLDALRVVQEETPQVTTVVEETHQRQTFDPRAARTLVVLTVDPTPCKVQGAPQVMWKR